MLEVITGPMYSGKTSELIRRLQRCQIAGLHTLVIKPAVDNRYSVDSIATHIGGTLKATSVKNLKELMEAVAKHRPEVIGIDEIQFMTDFNAWGLDIIDVLESEADKGYRVIAAGLDLDSGGNPFGPIAQLLAVADKVTKLTAVCVGEYQAIDGTLTRCGKPATRSYRLPERNSGKLIQIGSKDAYKAMCRICWVKHLKAES